MRILRLLTILVVASQAPQAESSDLLSAATSTLELATCMAETHLAAMLCPLKMITETSACAADAVWHFLSLPGDPDFAGFVEDVWTGFETAMTTIFGAITDPWTAFSDISSWIGSFFETEKKTPEPLVTTGNAQLVMAPPSLTCWTYGHGEHRADFILDLSIVVGG